MKPPCRFVHTTVQMGRMERRFRPPRNQSTRTQTKSAKNANVKICGRKRKYRAVVEKHRAKTGSAISSELVVARRPR